MNYEQYKTYAVKMIAHEQQPLAYRDWVKMHRDAEMQDKKYRKSARID